MSAAAQTVTKNRRQIGDGVILNTETIKQPPATYKYSVEPVGWHKIVFTFNFEGSINFELVDTQSVLGKPLQAEVTVDPFGVSKTVTIRQADVHKGGSLSMSMAWVLKEPDAASADKYMREFRAKIAGIVDRAKVTFPAQLGTASVPQIETICQQNRTQFVDITFPPNEESLYKAGTNVRAGAAAEPEPARRNPVIWRRPAEFIPEGQPIHLFEGKIEPNDIKQGQLGDCWLMCSLSSVAEFPLLVRNLFLQDAASESGVYQVRLCKNGDWVVVTLDDFFPCLPEGTPVYSRANGNELWVLLLEKAFAKVHGSYNAIRSGWAFEAMIDLTGAPYKDIRFSDRDVAQKIKDGSLWRYLCECDRQNFILSCSTGGVDKSTEGGDRSSRGVGLVPGHAYTLLTAVNTSVGGHRLLKVRNPWGSLEWNGDWSDKSSLWTPALKHELGFEGGDDGIFWISFEDLVKNFVGINICMVRHPQLNATPWVEYRHPFQYRFSKHGKGVISVPHYTLRLAQRTKEMFVSVHQRDKRCIGSLPYIDFGVTILQPIGNGKFRYIASSGNSVERQNQLEVKDLDAGEYLVIPTSTGCKVQQFRSHVVSTGRAFTDADYMRSAVLAIHSTEPFSAAEAAFDPEAYEEAMELPVIHGGTTMDLFGDGSLLLYTLKSGYAGLSYVAKNTTESDPISLTMDYSTSRNILSHRGALVADTVIPPGEAKVTHHISPADDTQDWAVGWTCNARWITEEEMHALKVEDISLHVE